MKNKLIEKCQNGTSKNGLLTNFQVPDQKGPKPVLPKKIPDVYNTKLPKSPIIKLPNIEDKQEILNKSYLDKSQLYDSIQSVYERNKEAILQQQLNKSKLSKFGTQRYQKGGLVNQSYSGTWGNRGQGNELQSALENGLSAIWDGAKWTWDKISNAGDYVEQGLAHVVGAIPGGMGREAYGQEVKNRQLAQKSGEPGYVNNAGQYVLFPQSGIPPTLPTLIKNPSNEVLDIYNRMKKLRTSWGVRESQLKKAGQLDKMPTTATYKRYKELENAYNKAIAKPISSSSEPVFLSKKQTAEFKHSKGFATGDGRANNQGRPFMRERQYDAVEEMIRKDPKAAGVVQRYDRKVAQGKDYHYLRQARIKMLLDYIKTKPGFFDWLKE